MDNCPEPIKLESKPTKMEKELKSLFEAASENRKNRVKKLCRKQVNLNYVSAKGENALNLAVANNHKEMVKYLVLKGALLYNEQTRPSTLIVAIQKDQKDMVELLLDLGADVQEGKDKKEKRVLPLSVAAGCLQYEIVELLIQKNADVQAVNPDTNRTALHEVARCFSVVFKYILGYSISSAEEFKRETVRVAKLLIENGADLNAVDEQNQTPLDAAISNNTELSKFLIREGARVRRETPDGLIVDILESAVAHNDDTLVKLCLQRGSDQNLSHAYYHSLCFNNPEVIKQFWAFGCPFDLPKCDIEKCEKFTNPIKPLKVLMGLNESVDELKQNQIKKERQNSAQMALYEGIKANDYVLVAAAVEKGALAKGIFMEYPSPLHHVAANKQDHKIAHILLEEGSPVNQLDIARKKTSLFFALLTANPNMIKEILKYGGCITKKDLELWAHIKNKEVQTILQEVTHAFNFTRKGSSKVLKQIEQFLSAGDKDMALVLMNCVDWRGRSVLSLAAERGHSKLTKRLMKMRLTHFN